MNYISLFGTSCFSLIISFPSPTSSFIARASHVTRSCLYPFSSIQHTHFDISMSRRTYAVSVAVESFDSLISLCRFAVTVTLLLFHHSHYPLPLLQDHCAYYPALRNLRTCTFHSEYKLQELSSVQAVCVPLAVLLFLRLDLCSSPHVLEVFSSNFATRPSWHTHLCRLVIYVNSSLPYRGTQVDIHTNCYRSSNCSIIRYYCYYLFYII